MGCTASRDARPPRRQADPAGLCRERAALARAVADRQATLASAHAAYLRSLAAVGGALRGFAAAALAAAPAAASSAVSPLSRSSSPDENLDAPRRNNPKRSGGKRASSSSTATTRRRTRASSTVPMVVYEDPYAPPRYAEGEAVYGEAFAEERPGPSPPAVSPWDFFDPFAHCDGFVEDYYRSCDRRKVNGVQELEEGTVEADASSKPSCSRAAGDQNAKARKRSPDSAASNRDPSGGRLHGTGSEPAPGGANGEAGKRPASSNPANGSSKAGVKKRWASFKGSVRASGANGGKEKEVSGKDAEPTNGSSRSKQEPKKKTSPTSSKGALNTGGGINDGTGSSSTQKKKKKKKKRNVVIEEEEATRSATRAGGDDESHGKPAAPSPSTSSPLSPLHLGTRSVTAAMDEVYWLFVEAANRGAAVSRVLGTGSAVTRRRNKLRAHLTVSTSSSCLPKPRGRNSTASRSKRSTSSSSLGTGTTTNHVHDLSSTLEKLWVCEEKLHEEMKDKDKLLKQHKKMHTRLKSLDKQGAESSAIDDSTRMSVSLLRSRISVSTSTANVLSRMVEKIRDEELYPQLADLVRRFRALWKAVLDCHEKQLSAILDADGIHRLKAVTLSQSSVASMASEELERELTNWRRCFHRWIGSQKSFVEALNRWLEKRLPDQARDEEEEDEDTPRGGPQPASLAIISKKWLRATEKVPAAEEALRAMDHFSKLVHEFKKSQEDEHRRRQKADRACREYYAKSEDLKAAFGLITGLDVVAVMENPCYEHDDRVRDLVKARRRRDEERNMHDETLRHAHTAASATLPLGLVPMLQQIICFFQGNLHAYTEIRSHGTT